MQEFKSSHFTRKIHDENYEFDSKDFNESSEATAPLEFVRVLQNQYQHP